jgi:hypothetical protein
MDYVILQKAKELHNFLVWDVGCGAEHAKRLADDGNKVAYYTEWAEPYTKFIRYVIGSGLKGVTKVKDDFYSRVDGADCIVFLDIGHGDFASWLRTKGYTVFGAGNAERLEADRIWAKEEQKKVGLPVWKFKVIRGVDNVIKHIEKNPKKYIKINMFRGDFESDFVADAKVAASKLNPLKVSFGPWADVFEFIIEDPIPNAVIESGWDLWFNGEDYLKPYLWGCLKEKFYIGKYVDKLPEPLERVAEAIKPILKGFNYRGAISVEIIITKDLSPYVIDWTCRLPSPLGFMYTDHIRNYSDLVYGVAKGLSPEIKIDNEYVGYKHFESVSAGDKFIIPKVPNKYKDKIKIMQLAKLNGISNAVPVPGSFYVGAAVASGSSIDNVLNQLDESTSEIDVEGCEIDAIDRGKIDSILEGCKAAGCKL